MYLLCSRAHYVAAVVAAAENTTACVRVCVSFSLSARVASVMYLNLIYVYLVTHCLMLEIGAQINSISLDSLSRRLFTHHQFQDV
jgi:hypothetical protein